MASIEPGKTTIIEPTSGNTGIALAFVCAAKGYELMLTMPETMSREREGLLRLYGARVEITEARAMNEAIDAARALADAAPTCSCPTSSRTRPTRRSTAVRPARDLGRTDGTGRRRSSPAWAPAARSPASARCSRRATRRCRVIAVEPSASAVLVGRPPGPAQDPGHRRGLRSQRPQPRLLDEVIAVDDEAAFEPPGGWRAGRASWPASRPAPRMRRRWRSRAGPSRGKRGSSRSCRTPASATCRPRSSRRSRRSVQSSNRASPSRSEAGRPAKRRRPD